MQTGISENIAMLSQPVAIKPDENHQQMSKPPFQSDFKPATSKRVATNMENIGRKTQENLNFLEKTWRTQKNGKYVTY